MIKVVLLTFLALGAVARADPIVRERGAIYLSDFAAPAIELSLKEPAPCYFALQGQRYAGTLRFPQKVKIDAVSQGGMIRVRGQARQGGVVAWIDSAFLPELPSDFVANLQAAEKRKKQVDQLIAGKKVAIGMTPEEVAQSLGEPQKRSRKLERGGSAQTYEYIKYELIPQTVYTPAYAESVTGVRPNPRDKLEKVVVRRGYGYDASTVYLKVPVGTVSVDFIDGIAETIQESQGTLVGANASMVVPPINLGW